mmetsp:Transcript_45442/g.126119  ORF Transcript_45442/g.126119 Transcript_45442/m.126119 type:complete len:202 (-) Transcript_45442:136-741(-)
MVTATFSPSGQRGAPPRPVSKKLASTQDTYSSKDIAWLGAFSDPSCRWRKRSAKSGRCACSLRHASSWSSVGGVPSDQERASAVFKSATKSARTPTSSPAVPPPGRGKLEEPRCSPSTSAKNSSESGNGTMKPSLSAWPMQRPRNRNLRTASSSCGPATNGRKKSPRRHNKKRELVELSSSTHIGARRFTSRSWRVCATST